MLSKLLEKTNPSGIRATWTKLRSYLKKPSIPAAKEQAVPKAASHKPYLMAVHNKVKQEITRRLGNPATPDFIKVFLHTQWSRLLLKIYLKRGPKSDAWKKHAMARTEAEQGNGPDPASSPRQNPVPRSTDGP